MSIDLSQFHQVFFEESLEGLDIMESALMDLDINNIDSETINTIFRAAHSIKGGSATFGFSSVADFTHVLETLLDEVREGQRGLTPESIELLLQSVDCLRDQLDALQAGTDPDTARADELKRSFEAILAVDSSASVTQVQQDELQSSPEPASQSANAQDWDIDFKPGVDVLKTGNDPLRMLRELSDLGAVSVVCDSSKVPDFSSMEPDTSYLSWKLRLNTTEEKTAIDEVFEWVIDESDLSILPAASTSSNGASPAIPNAILKASSGARATVWDIYFKPGKDIIRSGNEPLRMLRELAELGELDVQVELAALPTFSALEPEVSYLAWHLQLVADIEESAIAEVFEWVADESELSITRSETSERKQDSLSVEEEESPPVSAPPSTVAEPVNGQPDIDKGADTNVRAPSATADSNGKASARKVSAESSSIRVGIDKIDSLINMVGELVITQSMLGQLGSDFDISALPKMLEGLGQLEQNTRELQESVMRIRMLPISFAFSRFPRMVRDLSKRLDKQIHLELLGEQTELDKTVMEKIGDPLVHLVRNAVDHGIETIAERKAAGKDPTGRVTLNAFHQGGNVVIEIIDDGKGMGRDMIVAKAVEKGMIDAAEGSKMPDQQVFDLIFQPGFSTAAEVSDVSGRGVGMDVVRRNIQDLNGSVELSSKAGVGSTITIRLPLTLAILDGQLIRVGKETYIFPLVSIIESLQITKDKVNDVAGGCDVFQLRDEYVPIIRLYSVFDILPDTRDIDNSLLVVVENDGQKVGVVVDELLAQQQVVIKSLEQNYQRVEGISGATILGDGTVALILDTPGLVKIAGSQHQASNPVVTLSKSLGMQETSAH